MYLLYIALSNALNISVLRGWICKKTNFFCKPPNFSCNSPTFSCKSNQLIWNTCKVCQLLSPFRVRLSFALLTGFCKNLQLIWNICKNSQLLDTSYAQPSILTAQRQCLGTMSHVPVVPLRVVPFCLKVDLLYSYAWLGRVMRMSCPCHAHD